MWKDVIKNDESYKEFQLIEPTPFNVLFKDVDLEYVQLNSIQEWGNGIVGFCGCFQWKDNKIISIDGDSYKENMLVYGYRSFNWIVDASILVLDF